ncbi:MAG: hypothetical protein KJZ86_14325 [Caldilineaceae bacterium]|nr:hypothetical protein [Caldilineaceae bacterium]HRJ40701.1 nitrilase-related carbon-nitrogen hydrolase [Caldilineaceae bacterium]
MELSTKSVHTSRNVYQLYLWLAVGVLLAALSSGRWYFPLGAWLAPVFFLYFLRGYPHLWRGYGVVVLASLVVMTGAWWGVFPVSFGAGIVLMSGVVSSIPYLVDRWLSPRLGGFAATLVFPLFATAWEFVNMAGSPLGSFGATAYSQVGFLPLLQIVSITGMWSITFLMAWFASMAAWAWEENFRWTPIRRGVLLYAAILALVLFFGAVRLTTAAPAQTFVTVAGITPEPVRPLFGQVLGAADGNQPETQATLTALYDAYFTATRAEAEAGAQIVLWPEGAALGYGEGEAALVERAKATARAEGIYLGLPLFTAYPGQARPGENRLLLIDPKGEVALEHVKFGGNFLEGSLLGDKVLRTTETPFGTLAGVICWDLDFVVEMRQAGRAGVDLLLVPSNDWQEITPFHGRMAILRAIENGVGIVRQTDHGLSIAIDSYGRTLAEMDHFSAAERRMVVQMPVGHVKTLYPVIGDIFGWLAVAGFMALGAVTAITQRTNAIQRRFSPIPAAVVQ